MTYSEENHERELGHVHEVGGCLSPLIQPVLYTPPVTAAGPF
jgi:hypothetical protein